MIDVAILGAGELGGLLAHVLARRDIVRAIRLVDKTGQVAAGKALDIMQSSPIEGFSTHVSGATDFGAAAGADVVVIADQMVDGEWQGDAGMLLLKQVSFVARSGIVLCAGAMQRELVERGVRELRFRSDRMFGSAPEALASAARAMVALETDGSPADVQLSVLGVPPGQIVVPWEDASIGGFAAVRMLDEPARRRVSARLAPLWPPGPFALAAAATEAIAGLAGISNRTLSCFLAPKDDEGRKHRSVALPARIGPVGVTRVEVPTLSASARVALENAMLL